jgi:methyl-accepting chemotaxis protein
MEVSLRFKILVLILLPFLVLGTFIFDKIGQNQSKIKAFEGMKLSMLQLEHTSELTHQLQNERDLAVNFTAYPSMSSENNLRDQLHVTDSVEAYYRAFMIENNLDTSDFFYLNNFQELRESITAFSFEVDQVESYYNGLVRNYLDLVVSCGAEINIPRTKKEIIAYLAISEAKEGFGEIRNMINKAVNSGSFQGLEYGLFSSKKGMFENNLNAFMKHSSKDYKLRFQTDLQNGSLINCLDVIYTCFEAKTNDLLGFTSNYWWNSSKGMCEYLYEVQLFAIKNINESLNAGKKSVQDEIYLFLLIFSLVLFGLIVFVAILVKGIFKQIDKLSVEENQYREVDTELKKETIR